MPSGPFDTGIAKMTQRRCRTDRHSVWDALRLPTSKGGIPGVHCRLCILRRDRDQTHVGSSARLWIFSERSTYLIPFIPAGQGLVERSEYLEISAHGREIADGLEYMKKHMTPPRELLNITPSPRPANATLPAGWHDSEVV